MLRITKQTDYGIVLLTHFGAAETDALLTAKDLSERTRIPQPMVSKTLKILARDGLLSSQRGVNGGYGLAKPAQEITLADIIESLEGRVAMTECSEYGVGDCRIESSCMIRVNWQRINGVVLEALGRISLAEMIQPFRPQFVGAPMPDTGSDGETENRQ